MRETRTGVIAAGAWCDQCGAENQNRNALGWAARHHDKTGHTVRAEQTVSVVYGQSSSQLEQEVQP